MHALGDDRADAFDGGDLLLGSFHDPIEVTHGPGQHARPRPAEMPDVQPHQKVRQGPLLRRVDGPLKVADGDLAEPFQLPHSVVVDAVNVGHVLQQRRVHAGEHPDAAFTETLNVHRPSRREVANAADALARAVEVGAEGVALAFQPH